jgi:predicted TIM-barrel fold metal-dependent hydrolase
MQAVALAMRCPNVYLMPEFYWYLPGMPGAGDYVDAANTFLRHRTLFSSCYPSRTVGEAVAHVGELPLAADSVEPVFAGNARRLLGLP